MVGCGQCPFKFSGRDELLEHLYKHRHVGIICDMCGVGMQTSVQISFSSMLTVGNITGQVTRVVRRNTCVRRRSWGRGDLAMGFGQKERRIFILKLCTRGNLR